MGKPTICIGEKKGADHLRSNWEDDQRLCFRYTDRTIPILLKSEISSFYLSSVAIHPDLCLTCTKNTLLVFPRGGSIAVSATPHFPQLRDLHHTHISIQYVSGTYHKQFVPSNIDRGYSLKLLQGGSNVYTKSMF